MNSKDDVGITFVNLVPSVGYHNGVVNVSLGAFQFTPQDDGKTVDPDPVIVSRLRMDEAAATLLRDSLTNILQAMADARVKAQVDAHAAKSPENGVDRKETMN